MTRQALLQSLLNQFFTQKIGQMFRILLVEDNDTLAYVLATYLEMNGYQVLRAENGNKGWELFQVSEVDVCLVDVMLPEKDGFWLAEQIKSKNLEMPLIFLTAKSLKIDKLKGFKLGADDYIVKPVDDEELLARIQAVINRSKNLLQKPQPKLFHIGKYIFDSEKQILQLAGENRNLSQKESETLKLLCENKNRVVDRNEALKKLWKSSDYFSRRSMDVYISKLRKYLSEDPSVNISNIHGKGFILTDHSSPNS